MQAVMKKKYK